MDFRCHDWRGQGIDTSSWPNLGLFRPLAEPSAALFVVHTGDPVVPSSGICLLGGDQIMLLEADIS